MLAVVAVLTLVLVLVWYQSTGISTRQRWRGDGRFGQLAPEPPWPKGPTDPDARFTVLPRRRIVVPAAGGTLLVVVGAALVVTGFEPIGAFAVVIGLLELGAAASAAARNRRAVEFTAERLRDG